MNSLCIGYPRNIELMGKIGRDKVCALVKGNVEQPSDISGIVYIEMDSRKAWHRDVAKEMVAAGYLIDGSKYYKCNQAKAVYVNHV